MSSRSFKCVNNADDFCYVCGKFASKKSKLPFTDVIQEKYREYFKKAVQNLGERWTPSIICTSCKIRLYKAKMNFTVPMIWKKPLCHETDCYFCLSKRSGTGKSMKWTYANIGSAILPRDVPSPEIRIPSAETTEIIPTSESGSSGSNVNRFLTQAQLNDFVKDLELSKEKAEMFASRMKQYNFLAPGVKTSFRERDKPYSKHYEMSVDNICFCNDIAGLFEEIGQPYEPKEWRLFIDSSKESLKAVLLHIGNKKPSIPIGHAVNTKESYEAMVKLLHCIRYEQHKWKVCSDLKVVGMLCGMQGGYTKYCCFLCLWDSRDREQHYRKKQWPKRFIVRVGENNIKYVPLVKKEDIILPPLHIKLGLIKNFVKALDKEGEAFQYLRTLFNRLSEAKIKEGIFDGPHIRKLLKDGKLQRYLSSDEAAAWKSFQLVVKNFLGNKKSKNYKNIIEDLLKNYAKIGMYFC